MAWMGCSPRALSKRQPLSTDVLSMGKRRVIIELWQFLREEKKYWLMPIVLVFVLFGLLMMFGQSSAVAPFIYTLF
jgi:hypothetical protein